MEKPFNHDLDLMKAVKDALLQGTESAGIDVKVSAEDGVVRLSGVVDVLSHKRAAEAIARRVAGVRHVDNDITVANEETLTDKDLQAAVTGKLAARPEFRQIGCKVHKGVVTLLGHAGSRGDIAGAIRLVEGMAGVRDVVAESIKVDAGEKKEDADLSRAAQRLLDQMGYDHTDFQVYSDAGVLFVKGFVHTREDRSRLKTALHQLSGVGRVEALLITDDQMGGEVH
jgi:hyperosmotically inducible protein